MLVEVHSCMQQLQILLYFLPNPEATTCPRTSLVEKNSFEGMRCHEAKAEEPGRVRLAEQDLSIAPSHMPPLLSLGVHSYDRL